MRSGLFARARSARFAAGRARNAPVDGNIRAGRLDRPGGEFQRRSRRGLRVHHLSSHCPRRTRARKRFPFPLRSRKRRAERVSRVETLDGGGRVRLQGINEDEPASFRSSTSRRRRRGGGDPGRQDAPRPPSNVQKTRGVLRTRRDWRDRSISARRGVSVAVTGPIKRFEALAGVLSRFHAAPGAWRARAYNGREDDEEREECSKLGEVCQQKLQIRRLTTRILNSKTTVCASRRRKTPRKRRTDGGRVNTKVFCMIRFYKPKVRPDSCLTAISSSGWNISNFHASPIFVWNPV